MAYSSDFGDPDGQSRNRSSDRSTRLFSRSFPFLRVQVLASHKPSSVLRSYACSALARWPPSQPTCVHHLPRVLAHYCNPSFDTSRVLTKQGWPEPVADPSPVNTYFTNVLLCILFTATSAYETPKTVVVLNAWTPRRCASAPIVRDCQRL